jgi:hypothetical protein
MLRELLLAAARSAPLAAAAFALPCRDADAPAVGPVRGAAGLRVWAEVRPGVLSVHDSVTTLRIRVYAANPSYDALRVASGGPPYRLTPDPTQSRGLAQSVRIADATRPLHAGPETDFWGDSVHVFGPRETQYREFPVTLRSWRAGGWAAAPGEYRVRGYFNGHEGTSATLVLTP